VLLLNALAREVHRYLNTGLHFGDRPVGVLMRAPMACEGWDASGISIETA